MRPSTLGLLGFLGLAACRATEPNASVSPFLVSNPSRSAAAHGLLPSAGTSDGSVVYVSLPTGTIPDGLSALIVNQRTGQSVGVELVDGGLDPTAIAAVAGDTLDIIVSLRSGGQESFIVTVPIRARPKVVRTEPSPHKRDVPLNASIIVVFSEPIDAGSLSSNTLMLQRGSTTISGQIAFLDDSHASVVFKPDGALAPLSDFVLLLTSALRDLDGEQLEAGVTVPFTTAAGPSIGELQVSVTSFGNAMDPDGYVLAIAGQTNRPIAVNDTVSFQLPDGTYTVYLSGIANYCFALGSETARITVAAGVVTALRFKVNCLNVPADGLLVTVSTAFYGRGWPTDLSFSLNLDYGPDQAVAPNGYFIFSPVAPGNHAIKVHWPGFGGGSFCGFSTWPNQTVTVPADTFGRIDYKIVCIP